jgi:hypothetical protein
MVAHRDNLGDPGHVSENSPMASKAGADLRSEVGPQCHTYERASSTLFHRARTSFSTVGGAERVARPTGRPRCAGRSTRPDYPRRLGFGVPLPPSPRLGPGKRPPDRTVAVRDLSPCFSSAAQPCRHNLVLVRVRERFGVRVVISSRGIHVLMLPDLRPPPTRGTHQTAVSSSFSRSQRAAFAAWASSTTTFLPAA